MATVMSFATATNGTRETERSISDDPNDLPIDIALVRKRSALRITWRVPTRSSRDGRSTVPHQAPVIDRETDTIGRVSSPGQYDEVLTRTEVHTISAELLRVEAPSTDVKGAGVLVYGKRGIIIEELVVVGNYAVRLLFDDGHDTGIYSWRLLHDLGARKFGMMRSYLRRLAAAGRDRTPKRRPPPPA